ncbi:hypothetical protein ABIF53_005113 [Bradyrhizobium japonicum]
MHAVIFGMLGISDEHRRKASPVHCCCASAEKAKLEVVETIETMGGEAQSQAGVADLAAQGLGGERLGRKRLGHLKLPLAPLQAEPVVDGNYDAPAKQFPL